MMTFLNNYVGYPGPVLSRHLTTSIPNSSQLSGHHSLELALTNAISEHYQFLWCFLVCLSVKLYQETLDDVLHVLDHLLVLIRLLDSDLNFILHLGSWIH